MAVKKSELYSSLWAGCDELRGSMDASQYKDYVLVLLFMKYVSDKGGALVEIPEGGSFKDMVKLKGQPQYCSARSLSTVFHWDCPLPMYQTESFSYFFFNTLLP